MPGFHVVHLVIDNPFMPLTLLSWNVLCFFGYNSPPVYLIYPITLWTI